MAGIGELSVSITARTQKATANIKSFRKTMNSLPAVISKASTSIAGIGTAVAGLAGAASVGNQIKKSFENIDGLAKTADKLGIATEKLSALRFAAEESGVAATTTDMALQRMVRRISEAKEGTGEAVGALKELGLSAARLASMSPDQQFASIADAMAKVTNQGDRVRLSMKLFDSEGVALVNTLKLGSQGLSDYEKRAKLLGLAVNRFDAGQIEKANDAFGRIGKAIEGISNRVAIGLAPVIEMVANKTVNWGANFGVSSDKVLDGIEQVAKAAGLFADGISFWTRAYKSVRAYLTDFFAWYAETIRKTNQQFVDMLNKIPGVHVQVSQTTNALAYELANAAKLARKEAEKAWSKPLWSDSIDSAFKQLRKNIEEGRRELEKAQQSGGNSPFAIPDATGLGVMIGKALMGANQMMSKGAINLAQKLAQSGAVQRSSPGIINARSAEGYAALRSSMNGNGMQTKLLEAQKDETRQTAKVVTAITELAGKIIPTEIVGFES